MVRTRTCQRKFFQGTWQARGFLFASSEWYWCALPRRNSFRNFIKLIKLHSTGSCVSPRLRIAHMIASLNAQYRQGFCLVEMAPSAQLRRPPRHRDEFNCFPRTQAGRSLGSLDGFPGLDEFRPFLCCGLQRLYAVLAQLNSKWQSVNTLFSQPVYWHYQWHIRIEGCSHFADDTTIA